MTIKELETLVDLPRTSIRYYEREGLIAPSRSDNNYRDYTQADADALQKIKLLRKLHLEVDTIRLIQQGSLSLDQALDDQLRTLERDQNALTQAREVCHALRESSSDYDHLNPLPWLERLERDEVPPSAHFPTPSDTLPPLPVAPYPIRRFLARELDYNLMALVVLVFQIFVFRIPDSDNAILNWLAGYLILLPMLAVEAVLLHLWGTTPGKWLLGLSLRDRQGKKLSLARALRRSRLLFSKGYGYNIPIYNLYRHYKSFRICAELEPLPWDQDETTSLADDVAYTAAPFCTFHGVRWTAAVLLVLFTAVSMTFAALRPPCRGDLTVAELSRNYNHIVTFFHLNLSHLDDQGQRIVPPADPTQFVVNLSNWDDPVPTYTVDDTGHLTALSLTWEAIPPEEGGGLYLFSYGSFATLVDAVVAARHGLFSYAFAIDAANQKLEELLPGETVELDGGYTVSAQLEGTGLEPMGNLEYFATNGEPVDASLTLTLTIP